MKLVLQCFYSRRLRGICGIFSVFNPLLFHTFGRIHNLVYKHKVRGTGNHARAHPLYSGWNVMAQLSLRLVQGRNGVYYCRCALARTSHRNEKESRQL